MHLFGLHIKSLINLKIDNATFGIGGQLLPLPPPGYVPGPQQPSVGPGIQHTAKFNTPGLLIFGTWKLSVLYFV